jgi:predicted nucleic acid-binding protein
MWVFDATPLIYLAKADRLTLVQQLAGPCVIPERVYEEVVATGVEQGYPDARRIERSVEDDWFDVVTVEPTSLLSRLRTNSNLSDADAAVLACADAHDGVAVMDETYGRDVAAVEGITTRGTAYLVLHLAKQGTIGVDDARTAIDSMIDAGWYCAPDVYAKIVQKLESVAD